MASPRRSLEPPVAVRESSDMIWARDLLVACQAGARPYRIATTNAVAAEKVSTRRSKVSGTESGNRPGGTIDGAAFKIAAPTAMPSRPPSTASTRLSVSN